MSRLSSFRLAARAYSTSSASSTAPAVRRAPRPRRSKPSVFEPIVPKLTRNTLAPATPTNWASPLSSRAGTPHRLAPSPSRTYDPTLSSKTPQLPTLRDGVKALKLSLLPGGKKISTSLGLLNPPRVKLGLDNMKKQRTKTINEEVGGDYEAFTVEGLGEGKEGERAVQDAKMAASLNESLGKEGKRWLVQKVQKVVHA